MSKRVPTSTRSIDMHVTPEIIDRAVVRNSGHCLVADALKAAMPDATRVSVDLQTIRFTLPSTGRRFIYLTPESAQHLLIDFDQGICPIETNLRLSRPIQSVPINRKADRGVSGVEQITHNGQSVKVKVGGHAPAVGALADPPKKNPPKKSSGDPDGAKHRYAGQRRTFGLRILRP